MAMLTVDELMDHFGGTSDFARALGIKVSTAGEMRRRASIPVRYWPKLRAIARQHKLRLDYEKLVEVHTAPNSPIHQRAIRERDRKRAERAGKNQRVSRLD